MMKTSKLQNIVNLKKKIVSLHNQLTALENIEKNHSKSPINLTPTNVYKKDYQLSKNYATVTKSSNLNQTQFKNPTFWGGNPILGQQSTKKLKTKPLTNRRQKQSEVLNNLINKTLNELNKSNEKLSINGSKEKLCPNKQKSSITTKKQNIPAQKIANKTCIFGSASSKLLDTHKDSKQKLIKINSIKTFPQKQSNPILDPPLYQRNFTKKFIKKTDDIQNIYTDNINSNEFLYFSPNFTPLFLSPKAAQYRSKKNDSASFRNILSSSVQKKNEKPTGNNGKKHFTKQFQDLARNIFEG